MVWNFAPFLSYSEILVENRQFEPTPALLFDALAQYMLSSFALFDALVGVTPSEFRRDLWRQKTGNPGL